MNIRKTTAEDAPKINDLSTQFSFEQDRDWNKLISSEISEMFVLEENNQIIGFTGLKYHDWNKTVQIIDVFVHPDYRNQGKGKELVKYLINHLRGKDYRTLLAEAPSLNSVLSLYLKSGFRICGFNDRYYSNDGKEIAVFMSYDLT